jgi:GDPmannose 4,6-dehydratase
MKNAVITGITGQDAAYLAELLLGKGYSVYGTYRPSSDRNFWRLEALDIKRHANLHLVEFEATDLKACRRLLETVRAREVYNLAGQTSAVAAAVEPLETAQANGMQAVYLLEAIRKYSCDSRFFQAGSSELFGESKEVPQLESTAFSPTSPYGVAKLFAHWETVNYREAFGVFGTSGILFNHESPLRGLEFVTRKITSAFARIKLGSQEVLELGNLDAKRDWGYARDFVLGMWSALQADESDTFIFATNRIHTVRDFVSMAASASGFDLAWSGSQENECGVDCNSGSTLVRVNPRFYRPLEIHQRVGNPDKAFRKLGWRPTTNLAQLCELMVNADILRNLNGPNL